jgi:hypothetical protein
MRTRGRKSTGWRSRFAGWTTNTLENAKEGVYPIRNRVLGLDFLFDFPGNRLPEGDPGSLEVANNELAHAVEGFVLLAVHGWRGVGHYAHVGHVGRRIGKGEGA